MLLTRKNYISIVNFLNILGLLLLFTIIYSFRIDKISFLASRGIFLSGVVIMLLLCLDKGNKVINKIHFFWLLSLIPMLISSFYSYFKEESIKYVMYFSAGILYFIYFSNKRKLMIDAIKIQKIFSIIFALFTILPLIDINYYYKILEFLFASDSVAYAKSLIRLANRYPGIGKYPGNNGFILSMGLGICLSQLIVRQHRVSNFICIIIFITSILLTGSRYSFLASLISIILILFFFYRKNTYFSKSIKYAMILILIFTCIFLAYYFLPSSVFNRFFNKESIYKRLDLYKFAWNLFLERPILGHGINTFLYYTFYETGLLEQTYTHNVFLQLLLETGIIGFLFIVTPFILTLFFSIKISNNIIYKTNSNYNEEKNIKIALQFSLYFQFIFLIYFLIGNPIYDYNLLFLYFIFASYPICLKDHLLSVVPLIKNEIC